MRLRPFLIQPLSGREWTIYIAVFNFLLLFSEFLNQNSESPANFFEKSKELISFNLPESNFYPIGSALLLTPFAYLPQGALVSLIFFSNIGIASLALIAKCVLKPLGTRALIFITFANTYFFWCLVGSQDSVIEFALMSLLLVSILRERLLLTGLVGGLLVLVRPGNSLWVLGLAIGLALFRRSPRPLCAVAMLGLVVLINTVQYGSPGISYNVGYAARIGWTEEHYFTHPLYDYDVGISTRYKLEDDGTRTEAEQNSEYLKGALTSVQQNPQRSLLLSLSKLESSLFHIQKVPRMEFAIRDQGEENIFSIDEPTFTISRTAGEAVYFVHRIVVVLLLAFAVVLATIFRRYLVGVSQSALLLPLVGLLPASILTTTDTRFQVTAEVLALIWSLRQFERLRSTLVTQNDAGGTNLKC